MRAEQEAYADSEAKLDVSRKELKDGRVDCVLYFLPTNARIGESDLDFTVINALAAYAPVIPLMCKVLPPPSACILAAQRVPVTMSYSASRSLATGSWLPGQEHPCTCLRNA
jgi:hypothetical protein